MNCHFCKDCLELIKEAKDEGRELTPSDLEINKLRIDWNRARETFLDVASPRT